MLDCADLNEAIAWAARIPTACGGSQGSIEIRQLVEFPGVPESLLKPHPRPRTSLGIKAGLPIFGKISAPIRR